MAFRVDYGTLRPIKRTVDGRARVDATLTRSGVFVYRNNDGTERREYRPPNEVFNKDSMRSFELQPVTKLHPSLKVDTSNAKTVGKGIVLEGIKRDGNHMVASLLIDDADLIASMERGDMREVSCGYECEMEDKAGTSPEGERYDSVQHGILGNHVAIVPGGRAGSARVRIDRTDAAEQVSMLVSPSNAACVYVSSRSLAQNTLADVVAAALTTAGLETARVVKMDAADPQSGLGHQTVEPAEADPGLPAISMSRGYGTSVSVYSAELSANDLFERVQTALKSRDDVVVRSDSTTPTRVARVVGSVQRADAITQEIQNMEELQKKLGEALAAQATEKARADAANVRADAADKQVKDLQSQIAKTEGERDAAKDAAKAADKARQDAADAVETQVSERVDLISKATIVLGAGAKIGDKSLAQAAPRDVQLAVVKKVDKADVDKDAAGKPRPAEYISARFDSACERATTGAAALANVRQDLATVRATEQPLDGDDAEAKAEKAMKRDGRDAWKRSGNAGSSHDTSVHIDNEETK